MKKENEKGSRLMKVCVLPKHHVLGIKQTFMFSESSFPFSYRYSQDRSLSTTVSSRVNVASGC